MFKFAYVFYPVDAWAFPNEKSLEYRNGSKLVKGSNLTNYLILPLRFRKAGRVLCGGARETH